MIKSKDIKLLFYSTKKDPYFINLSNSISSSLPSEQVDCYQNIKKFSEAVRDTLFGLAIIVIIARNEKELNDIVQIAGKLKDHSLILILDSSIDELTHRALQLFPRYTSYIKDDFTDILIVLEKMIIKIQNKTRGGENGR